MMPPESLKVFDLQGTMRNHTCMDQEQIKEAEAKVERWMADKTHRRCLKAAMCAANAVVLMGLTAGLALLWINELRRSNGRLGCSRHGAQQ